MNEKSHPEKQLEPPSKSQKKREASAIQALGERLLDLSDKQLREIDIPEALSQAVALAKTIKARSGRKRQLQYIGKLMRNLDTEPIEAYFNRLDANVTTVNAGFHRLERWRDRLVAEGNAALNDAMQEFPSLDLQHLRQLIRNARNGKNPKLSTKAKRELFQYLKQLIQEK